MSEWIEIAKQLPKREQPVALINIHRWENCNFDRNVQDVGYLADLGYGNEAYWSIRGERASTIDAYTHWCALPAAPK